TEFYPVSFIFLNYSDILIFSFITPNYTQMKRILLALFLSLSTSLTFAQTVNQNTGWLFFLNSTKFNEKWGMYFDLQVRTADEWSHVRNVLIRPGITYYFSGKSNATLGYLYTTTYNGPLIGTPKNLFVEHRIWQQYIYSHQPWKSATLSHRFRLEQRFIERQ